MSNAETTLKSQIMLDCGALPDVRLFNNPVGEGWQGKRVAQDSATITLLQPRRVVYGLCPGSSDIIGFRTVTITPDMVGTTVAQFIAPEVKTGTGRVRDDQVKFIAAVNRAGGLAGVVRSSADLLDMLDGRVLV